MLTGPCTKLFSVVGELYKLSLSRPLLIANRLKDTMPAGGSGLRFQHQSTVTETDEEEETQTQAVIRKVNDEIYNKSHGRLFAVVQLCGKQFKITDEDLVVLEGYWPPTNGDKIRLEKVLLVGSANFTLVGRPLLPKDQVAIYATVVEKTMSPTILWYTKQKRKRFQKTKLFRVPQTFLRINSIDINVGVNDIGDVDGLRDRIF